MSQAKITREEVKQADITYSAVLIELKNACIAILSEGDENLGTVAFSLPKMDELAGPSMSSVFLGERSTTIARVFAERLSKTMRKMVLVSVFLKTLDERKAANVFWDLLDKMLKKEETRG